MFQPSTHPHLGLALCAWAQTPARPSIAIATTLGYRAVQLDATHPEIRPRSLDRSARRDLASVLRRNQLSCTGLDLWLPPDHLAGGPKLERATEAVVGAIEFAREFAGLVHTAAVVSLALPLDPDAHAMAAIDEASRQHEVAVADHAWPAKETGPLGLDPALAIMAGQSAPKSATQLGARLASARLSDAGVSGRLPVDASGGSLDVPAYAAALSISAPNIPVVADVRSLPEPAIAAAAALRSWTDATEPFRAQESLM
ncbi:MAG: hypothetical protein AAFV77_03995 [Planctomycetota bacterium]